MGELAGATDEQRAETMAFAFRLLKAVVGDTDYEPFDMTPTARTAFRARYTWSPEEIAEIKTWIARTDQRVFRLAQDLVDTRAALEAACAALIGNYTEHERDELAVQLLKLDLTPLDDSPDA